MSVETFVPSTKLISLTDSAVKHFESKLKDKPGQLIRLSTKVSGCTGYAYVLDFADSAQADDEIVEISPVLNVAVAAQPLMKRFGIPGTARASFSIYNTLEEVDSL